MGVIFVHVTVLWIEKQELTDIVDKQTKYMYTVLRFFKVNIRDKTKHPV